MARLSEQAIAELRGGVARAKLQPTGFDMEIWAEESSHALPAHIEDPPCGVVGCLAFEIEAAIMEKTNITITVGSVMNRIHTPAASPATVFGRRWGITYEDVVDLFHIIYWPYELRFRYSAYRRTSIDRVNVLEEAVELWITNDGRFPEREY